MGRFQFSIRSIMVSAAIVSFIIAEKAGFSDIVAGYAGFFGTLAAAALAAVTAIEGTGSIRTFSIGALFPLGMMLFSFGSFMQALNVVPEPTSWASIGEASRNAFVVGWITSIAVGALCALCGMLVRRQT